MGFIKWLFREYKAYKIAKLLEPSQQEKDALGMRNFERCMEAGFTSEQIVALANLFSCRDNSRL